VEKSESFRLKNLNRFDINKFEKIASKYGIEMIHVDSTAVDGVLLERVRKWITEHIDR